MLRKEFLFLAAKLFTYTEILLYTHSPLDRRFPDKCGSTVYILLDGQSRDGVKTYIYVSLIFTDASLYTPVWCFSLEINIWIGEAGCTIHCTYIKDVCCIDSIQTPQGRQVVQYRTIFWMAVNRKLWTYCWLEVHWEGRWLIKWELCWLLEFYMVRINACIKFFGWPQYCHGVSLIESQWLNWKNI